MTDVCTCLTCGQPVRAVSTGQMSTANGPGVLVATATYASEDVTMTPRDHYPRTDGPTDSVLCCCGEYQFDGWTFPDMGLPPDFWQHVTLATPAPHSGENHEFRTTCLRCGESAHLHVALITDQEAFRIEPRPPLAPPTPLNWGRHRRLAPQAPEGSNHDPA